MHSRRLLTACLLASLLPACAYAQGDPVLSRVLPAADTAAAREVLRRTRHWHDAVMYGDTAQLRTILLAEFSLTGAPAVDSVHIPLEQYLRNMAAYQLHADRWEASDVRILRNVAVVTSRYWQHATPGGQDRSGYYVLTDVWQYADSAWRAESRWVTWLDTPGGVSPAVRRR